MAKGSAKPTSVSALKLFSLTKILCFLLLSGGKKTPCIQFKEYSLLPTSQREHGGKFSSECWPLSKLGIDYTWASLAYFCQSSIHQQIKCLNYCAWHIKWSSIQHATKDTHSCMYIFIHLLKSLLGLREEYKQIPLPRRSSQCSGGECGNVIVYLGV